MNVDVCHLSIAAVNIVYMHLTVFVCYLFWPFPCLDVMNLKLLLRCVCVSKTFVTCRVTAEDRRVLYACCTYLYLMVGQTTQEVSASAILSSCKQKFATVPHFLQSVIGSFITIFIIRHENRMTASSSNIR